MEREIEKRNWNKRRSHDRLMYLAVFGILVYEFR